MTEHLDAGWHDWVTSNLGRDPVRAAAATRAASDAVAQGRGFNAAADAARASWNADRLAQVAAVIGPDPGSLPGSLIAAAALAVGGALASIALILWMVPPTAPCTDYCPGTRNLAYTFLLGNVVVAALHGSLFLLMWRRRAAAAWWTSVTLVAAILLFDVLGELTMVAAQSSRNGQLILGGIGSLPALVPTAMLLFGDRFRVGNAWETISSNWLLLHLLLVELPILILISTRPARQWCRVYIRIGSPA